MKSLSRVQLFATLWSIAHQAPLSIGFSRQEYWSGLPFPFPGDLPNPRIKPRSPALHADALTSEPPGKPQPLLIKSTHNVPGTIQKYMVYITTFNIKVIIPILEIKNWRSRRSTNLLIAAKIWTQGYDFKILSSFYAAYHKQ